MSVLDSIIEGVREDLAARRIPLGQIHKRMEETAPALDAHSFLSRDDMNVIAEVKRSSPSKGELATITDPASLAGQYQEAGAAAVSVLTERRRFGGSLEDLDAVRKRITIPVLRKDFMVDEYQFLEARAHGADIVLLIVAALSKSQLRDFYDLATELGMASLIEVHTAQELESAMDIEPRIIGVNSRNLKTLDVDSAAFADLIPRIPADVIRVAESGIATRSDVEFAQNAGATAILVGETLVKSGNPISAMQELLGRR
ncbi:indole-3-glycerol phosphate synthase [Candidatus Planktophila sulfonica]|uniref:Indole-3-glycerol phosphate synthase n=1 Tax=Candidatus Planktophila sulfonica TaxID=1884904 RepID=A0A249KGD7_9ACTN|nr:indole-3-glycerol phosphate synthase TrpC [Candidatus Planktophila sulfonica]ASY15851.1 indole-3-glycerol phosphate synthase [Candidatus Planktophila sulfonica]